MINRSSAVSGKSSSFLIISLVFILSSCGGGGSGNNTTSTSQSTTVSGGGVKGPLANAVVSVYSFDASQPGLKSAATVATATTDANAAIAGLSLPFPVTPPYIMEFTSTPGTTTDITTGQFPVITTLRTVITQSLLDGGEQIYATPLTTMAVDIAIANSTLTTTVAQFETALTDAASQVVSTLGFGLDSSVDIFDTPPLVDNTTVSADEQADVAAYRAAVEAVTAIAFQINQQTSGGDTDSVLADLAADLADGGGIDGSVAGSQINTNTLQVLEQDPATLLIPNGGGETVADVQAILVREAAMTAPTTSVTELDVGGSIDTVPAPAETNPDTDGDGTLNVDDAFPNDAAETVDSDGDGLGDNVDPDDDNNGILDEDEGVVPAPTALDTDGDGVDDGADNCPAIVNTAQSNFDGDADGDACDADDDNDGTDDVNDAFPFDAAESVDTDGDGLGNAVADDDDDNDGLSDVDEGIAGSNPLLVDTDGDGVFDGADFAPTDGAVTFNFAPIALDDVASADEDAATFAISVTLNDSDDDGNPADSVTLSAIGSNDTAVGTAVINGNNIDYTPVADANGTDTFTYTVTDGTVSSTGSVTVTITAVNDEPVITQASPIALIMDEDGTPAAFVAPDIDAADADVGDTLNWSLSSVATGGSATVSGTGASPTVTYVPNLNFSGVDSFEATVSDGNGGSAVITIDVTVNAQNDAPVIAQTGPLVVAMDEDGSPITFVEPTISATDIDSGSLSWSGTAANDGTATVTGSGASPTITYVPDADFNGSDSFDVLVNDGVANSSITVNVTINAQNDVPVIEVAGPFSIAEDVPDATLVATLTATDVDGTVQGYNITGGNTDNAFAIDSSGQITVADTSVIDFDSGVVSYSLLVRASDGISPSDTAVVVVDITDVNDTAPIIGAAGPFVIAEDIADAAVVGSVVASDIDSPVTDYSITVGNDGGAFAISAAGEITVANTAAIDFESASSFNLMITATDGTNVSAGEAVTVTITDINDTAPIVAAGQSFNVLESAANGAVVGTVSASDADTVGGITGYNITGTVFAIDAGGVITVLDNATLAAGSPYTLTVDAADGTATSVGESVTITVTNNASPVITQAGPLLVTMDEDSIPQAFVAPAISATDAEDDSLTWSTTGAANGTATVSGTGASPTVIYEPDADYHGSDSFVVNVNDGTSTAGITVEVTVASVNDLPVASSDNVDATDEDTLVTTANVLTNDSDIDGPDALSVLSADISTANGGVVVNNDDGTFDYTPAFNFNGVDSFNYTVTDGEDSSFTTVTITVAAVNDEPVAADDTETAIVDAVLVTGDVLANDTDVDGPSLSVTAFDAVSVSGGTVADNGNGTFNYTSAGGYTGADSFNYTVSDGTLSDVGTVNITVTPAGLPIAMTDLLGAAEGGIVGLESYTTGNGVNDYAYWKDNYDGVSTFSFEDKIYNHLTAAFEVDLEDGPDISLNGAGSWVNQGPFRVATPNNGDGSMTVAVRDETDAIDVETVTLSALYVDINGQPIANYLDAQWQSAMFDNTAAFGVDAKLVTAYTFEHAIDAYLMFSGNWCKDSNPDRYAALNTTTINNNCNGIDVPLGVDASGFATTLDQLEVATPFIDDDLGGNPDVAVSFGWEDNLNLRVEFAPGNVANYYVIDYNAANNADATVLLATGAYERDTSVQGIDMIRFVPPAAAYVQFPEVMEESTGYQVTVEGGFVRLGDYILAGSVRSDISGLLNGHALNDVLGNFSGDNFTQAIEGAVLHDVYLDTGIREFRIDVNSFETANTFSAYDYQAGPGSAETGTWGVSATGVLHMVQTSGDEWWIKVKNVDPDTGIRNVCSSNSALGPFDCTVLDAGTDVGLSFTSDDEVTAVNWRDELNTVDPQLKVVLTGLDGVQSVITGTWGSKFIEGDLTTSTHTLDFGEGPVTLTFNLDGTGVMEFSPTEVNTILSWAVDVNGVLRFTDQASDFSTADWVVGYFDTTEPGNVLVQQSDGFFVMGGFDSDELNLAYTEAELAGLAIYQVFNNEPEDCGSSDWQVEPMSFDGAGNYTLDVCDGTIENGTYSVLPSGVIEITFNGGASVEYIRRTSFDTLYGSWSECWADTEIATTQCTDAELGYVFNDQASAQSFVDSVTFAGVSIDASTILAGGGIYEFYDDADFDDVAGVDLPGYWNLAYDGVTIVDQESLWSIALNKYLPAVLEQGVILTSIGWQLADDITDNIVLAGNTATLEAYEPGGTTVINSVSVAFEAMDISGGVQGHYVSTAQIENDSATFSSGAQWLNASYTQNLGTTEIGYWNDCGEPNFTNWGGNCNTVWVNTIDGSNYIYGGSPATSIAEFDGLLDRAVQLAYDLGSGELFGVFDGAGNITLYTNDYVNPATVVGMGTYVISDENNETFIDYTLPADIESSYSVRYEAGDGETGILAVHNGFLRYGEREPAGTGTVFLFNDVAGTDVINNVPTAPAIYGTWVDTNWLSDPTFVPDVVSLFADSNYMLSGGCTDSSVPSANDPNVLLGGEVSAGMELGPYTWNEADGVYVVNPVINTNGHCLLDDDFGGNSGTMSVTGSTMSIDDTTEIFSLTKVTSTTNPIVGSWGLGDANDPVIITFFDNGFYIESQTCLDHELSDGTPSPIQGGLEYGTYNWSDPDLGGDGLLTGNVIVDTDGWCGLHDINDASTAIGGGLLNITIDGDVMTIQPDGEPPVNAYRIQ